MGTTDAETCVKSARPPLEAAGQLEHLFYSGGMDPFRVLAAGCGGYVQHELLAPSQCQAEPTVTGLVLVGEAGKRRSVWRGFACDAHACHLRAVRQLLPRDRDLLAARRESHRQAVAGSRWPGEREGALAWGRQADELLARAEEWAQRHG